MPKRPRRVPGRILGVDFSGANDAGRKIWIAEGRRGRGNQLKLLDVRPAGELEGGGVAPAEAITALARHVAKDPDTIAGCDFPFTLPRQVIDRPNWVSFIAEFSTRFPDPDIFRRWALSRAQGREIRRGADRDAKTPFNSYNLRIYRQTWWGIAHFLHPLVTSGRAIVRPFQPLPDRPHPIVIEACPACTLKWLGFYPAYKGRGGAYLLERKAILAKLIEIGLLEPPLPAIQRRLLENFGGDALDAVIAAIASAHAHLEREPDAAERIEGIIYASVARDRVVIS